MKISKQNALLKEQIASVLNHCMEEIDELRNRIEVLEKPKQSAKPKRKTSKS